MQVLRSSKNPLEFEYRMKSYKDMYIKICIYTKIILHSLLGWSSQPFELFLGGMGRLKKSKPSTPTLEVAQSFEGLTGCQMERAFFVFFLCSPPVCFQSGIKLSKYKYKDLIYYSGKKTPTKIMEQSLEAMNDLEPTTLRLVCSVAAGARSEMRFRLIPAVFFAKQLIEKNRTSDGYVPKI